MSLDRLHGNELVMTQELIANTNTLGERREGVTEGALKLQKLGLTRYVRGHIWVLDRKGLEKRRNAAASVISGQERVRTAAVQEACVPGIKRPHRTLRPHPR